MNAMISEFISIYGGDHKTVKRFHAPGRVNLIGEYTDFNGGPVFPCAINRGTTLLVRQTDTDAIEFATANFVHRASIDPQQVARSNQWVDYPLGVISEFQTLGHNIRGLQMYYSGDVPNGAGLSSSASIEVLTAYALNALFGTELSNVDIALLCQRAENNFVGVQCGIMDQFAIAMAQPQHAIALQCDTLQYQQVPLSLGDYRIVISNTNQRRELGDSAYNERVTACQRAVELLHTATGANQLAQVTPEQWQQHNHLITDTIIHNRAQHVIAETDRVNRAIVALNDNDLAAFGQLMRESHASLRDLFEVSSAPLDCLVELALNIDGVLGSRMTGAGFGGCTVSLVHTNSIDEFISTVGKQYEKQMSLTADFYVTDAADGVRQITPV